MADSSGDPNSIADIQEAVNSFCLAKPQFPNSLLLIFVTPLLTNRHRSTLACVTAPKPASSLMALHMTPSTEITTMAS